MPEICRFFGIVILMNYADHNPPHFHARYGSAEAFFTIDPVAMLYGELPPRAAGLVVEWATQRRAELIEAWSLAHAKQPVKRIPPLE